MTCEGLHSITELRYLWKSRGNKNYNLKNFQTSDGKSINYIVFEDLQNCRNVFGKIVNDPREGEAYHWPRLQHENLAPFLDAVALSEKIRVYMFPAIGLSLNSIIHGKNFKLDSECFNRKRNYATDILSALDYLHEKSLCIMNLTDGIFCVSDVSDKAVLCNFECVRLIKRVTKEDLNLPILYQAPELKTEYFDPIAVELWACGVMFLQIFTNHLLPAAFIGEEAKRVMQAVNEINDDIIKEANYGAEINSPTIEELKTFLNSFLVEDPKLRVNIRKAAALTFLKSSRRMKIKNNFKSALWESSCADPYVSFENSKWMDSSYKNPLLSPFDDIYLKEKANCKNKHKNIPCTNKFINLKFVPQADNTIKHFVVNDSKRNENVGATDQSKEKFIADKTPSELNSGAKDDKPKESISYNNKSMSMTSKCVKNVKSLNSNNTCNSNAEDKSIGDNKLVPTSEFHKNVKCAYVFNNTDNSNFENAPNNFESEAENDESLIVDNETISITSECGENLNTLSMFNNIRNSNMIEKTIGDSEIVPTTSEFTENFKRANSDNGAISFNSRTVSNNFGGVTGNAANNEAYDDTYAHQNTDDANKSPAYEETVNENAEATLRICRSSSDSDISLDSLELARNNLEQACDTRRETECNSIDNNKPSNCESETDNTNINTENFCTLEDGTSLCLKVVHMNSVFKTKKAFEQNLLKDRESGSDSSTRFSTDVKEENDDLKYSTAVENKNEDYHQSDQIQRSPKSEILKLEVNVEEFSQNSVLNDGIMPRNQEQEKPKDALTYDDVNLHSDSNEELKVGGHLSNLVENFKEDKGEEIQHNNVKNMQQIDLEHNNDCQEEAVNNHARVHTEEVKLKTKKKRSFMKITFFHKKSSAGKKNVENNYAKPEKEENNESVLVNEGNIQVPENITNMKKCLLDLSCEEGPKKVKKRNWIRFLCPGSK